ncbi:hypothetical protein [Rathayibacter sp. VKM Ac-2754]|uniref:AraC-like ligand-binding domain-containing protein n=1 Tax=Rathayibacter sp. VKM Ac-2754 TaxID=2609251 RepID=UPI0013595550|nr:hypothetical protein [Rathayibacter sp. VKM Ac-2754]MWV58721.1 hypothetical protein [Rathayibacter sp. VKM Ac-2754]
MAFIAPGARPPFVRSAARHDQAASTWLGELGVLSRPSAPLRIAADVLRHDGIETLRIRHTPGRFSRRPGAGDGIRMLIPLEGGLSVLPDQPGAREVGIGEGDLAVLRRDTPFTLVSDAPTTRLEIELERPLIGTSIDRGALATTADAATRRILVSTINAVFAARLDARSPALPLVGAALEQLAGAVILASLPRDESEGTYAEALALISATAADPGLSVQALSARTGVPRRTLQRVFARHGTTVFGEIRRARLAAARALLGGEESEPPPDDALLDYVRSRRLQRDRAHLEAPGADG